jgi:spore coat protein H
MNKTHNKHDLPTYSLFIHPQDFQELRSDVWCDDPVPAKLKIVKKQYDIDIVYRGSLTREFPKKSFHIKLCLPRTFHGANELHLNAEYLDPSMMRNKLALDFFRTIGVKVPEARYVKIMINGAPAGVYLLLESVDENFLEKRQLPLGAIFYAIDDEANFSLISPNTKVAKNSLDEGYVRKCGTDDDNSHLRNLIYQINTIPRTDFDQMIDKFIDVDKYLRWLVGAVCTQNFDGFIHNYGLYRNSNNGLWEMIPWDYDATFGRDCKMKIMEYNYVPIRGYNTLTARLLDITSFRNRYRNLLEETLDYYFTQESFAPIISNLEQLLRPHLLIDPYKKQSIKNFDQEPEMILQFICNRNRYLRQHLFELD